MPRRGRPGRSGGSRLGTVIAVLFLLVATGAAALWLVFVATGGLRL